ncbi:MAG: phosphatidylcholine/phosphatidylserine synthase [Planctomycetes bacterium]|jgi:CDP-diacylglycerol--serine O-phosphatidyltransferase|nr:phosphatidylcholine/phosphatidylserine synthase [Planctomycetota bacterium]MCC7066223.1 phosphatidylcholine/phosphatidylserine synthase [Planctomycetota bacterium]
MTSPRLEDLPPLRTRRGLRRLKDVPVLPSLITLGNLFFGFLAIAKVADALRQVKPGEPFSSVVELFATASVLIFVAMVCDALDGRVARMTGQTTPFGAQLDSLADMVTFGTAPAFLAKVLVDWHAQGDDNHLLPMHPKLFYAAAAVYVLCAALRLARFNVETGSDEEDHREFKGLPSPAAASVVCALIALFCTRNDPESRLGSLSHLLLTPERFDWIVMAMPGVLVLLGLLMVSRVPYPHAMHWILRKRHSLPFLAGLVVLIVIAAVEWQFALAACTLGYVVSGVVLGLWRAAFRRGGDDGEDDDESPRPLPSRN